jgi:hypothetical protein
MKLFSLSKCILKISIVSRTTNYDKIIYSRALKSITDIMEELRMLPGGTGRTGKKAQKEALGPGCSAGIASNQIFAVEPSWQFQNISAR